MQIYPSVCRTLITQNNLQLIKQDNLLNFGSIRKFTTTLSELKQTIPTPTCFKIEISDLTYNTILVLQIKLHRISFHRSSFSDFAAKYGKDERFKGIEKMRERESVFSDYCSDLRRREKDEKAHQREKVRFIIIYHAVDYFSQFTKSTSLFATTDSLYTTSFDFGTNFQFEKIRGLQKFLFFFQIKKSRRQIKVLIISIKKVFAIESNRGRNLIKKIQQFETHCLYCSFYQIHFIL